MSAKTKHIMQEIRYKGAVLANTHLKLLSLLNSCPNALFPAILDFLNQVVPLKILLGLDIQTRYQLILILLRKMNQSGSYDGEKRRRMS